MGAAAGAREQRKAAAPFAWLPIDAPFERQRPVVTLFALGCGEVVLRLGSHQLEKARTRSTLYAFTPMGQIADIMTTSFPKQGIFAAAGFLSFCNGGDLGVSRQVVFLDVLTRDKGVVPPMP
jgi:hypothetical protein